MLTTEYYSIDSVIFQSPKLQDKSQKLIFKKVFSLSVWNLILVFRKHENEYCKNLDNQKTLEIYFQIQIGPLLKINCWDLYSRGSKNGPKNCSKHDRFNVQNLLTTPSLPQSPPLKQERQWFLGAGLTILNV